MRDILVNDVIFKVTFTCMKMRATIHSLLVIRCNITLYLLQNSLVTCCKKSLVTRCEIRSLFVTEVARCKKSLITRCKIRLLLVAEVSRCRNSPGTRCSSCTLQKVTRYSLQNSFVTRCRNCSLQKFTRYYCFLLHKVTKQRQFQLNLVMEDKTELNFNLLNAL